MTDNDYTDKSRMVQRYSRQVAVPQIGPDGQQRLSRARVLMVGAGGLGHPVAGYLAAAGVGQITIADDDVVSDDNLARQILFTEADRGLPKAATLAARLKANNSAITVTPQSVRITAESVDDAVAGHDVVLDATDNFESRYLLSDACLRAGVPHVWGAVYRFEGFVAVFAPEADRNYRALYPDRPPAHLSPTCATGGVVGPACGIVGSFMAAECLKLITFGTSELLGRVLSVDAGTLRIRIEDVVREQTGASDSGSDSPAEQPDPTPVTTIDPRDLRDLIAAGRAPRLIDVREGWERDLERIEHSEHVPLGSLWTWARTDPDGPGPTVFYCAAGSRSEQAVEIVTAVRRNGAELFSLAGGMSGWRTATVPEGQQSVG